MCEDWVLSIDLKLTNKSTKEWSSVYSLSVLRFQPEVFSNGSANLKNGSSLQAVWLRQDESNVMFTVVYNPIGIKFTFNVTKKFDNWINLKISHLDGVYKIKVDYKEVFNTKIVVSKMWYKIILVMGNANGTGFISAIGQYRNFDIITCPRKIVKY